MAEAVALMRLSLSSFALSRPLGGSRLWTSRSALATAFLTSLTLVGLLSGLCLLMAQGALPELLPILPCVVYEDNRYIVSGLFSQVSKHFRQA